MLIFLDNEVYDFCFHYHTYTGVKTIVLFGRDVLMKILFQIPYLIFTFRCSKLIFSYKSQVFATPETLIGFHPDAGASFYLSHLPGHLGMLAVTL
jgi:hypothetical protein